MSKDYDDPGKKPVSRDLSFLDDTGECPAADNAGKKEPSSRRAARVQKSQKRKRREKKPAKAPLTLHQEREQRKRRKRRRILVMIVAECIALALIFGYGYFLRRWNQIQRPDFNEEEIKNNDLDMDTIETMKGYWTIAIFGVDARDKALTKSTNADVNIICNINLDTGEIKLVSVYRDTYLNISKNGTYNKINQAYFIGGPEQAVSALNRNLDLNITDYMTFNWKAVADAINVLGGVDIEISKAEFYYINSFITETVNVTGIGSTQLTSAGLNHLDGVQAVAYGRLRLMDTDYARTERQRKVIQLAFEKAKKADLDTLNRVLATVFPQVATSINVNDIFNSLKIINRYHLGETTGFPQARGDANMGKKGACVIPQTLVSNVIKLHEFLFGEEDYTPSSTVQTISEKIAADSGMYKEGSYVESVGTDGGVIQSAKASKAAEASSSAEEDDKKYAVIYVLDEDGNKVKKTVVMETDADGDAIEPETDADGISTEWVLNSDGKLVRKSSSSSSGTGETDTEAETDEDGNTILTNKAPGDSDDPEDETDEDGNKVSSSTSSGTGLRPGFLSETDEDESDDEDDSDSTSISPTSSGSSTSTSPTSSGTSVSANPTSASGSASESSSTSPTAATTIVQQAPGTTSADGTTNSPSPTAATSAETISSGPGSSSASSTTITPTSGTVSGPGQ